MDGLGGLCLDRCDLIDSPFEVYMNKMLIPILFAVATAIFWGCYGPALGNAQAPRVDGRPLLPPAGWSPFKPYVFTGLAYLVIAIIGGLVMMKVKGDSFTYSGTHFTPAKWGFLAGVLGAFGALCLTSAMMISRGNALLVMPIVFGGAVSVSAVVSVLRIHGHSTISPLLWVGMLTTVIGVVVTAMNTPAVHGSASPKPTTTTPAENVEGGQGAAVNPKAGPLGG
jgi:uncharacterized membrane protein